MDSCIITGTGVFTPPHAVSNEELVACFNEWVNKENDDHKDLIDKGEKEALAPSSVEFIVKASGIKSRYVMAPSGILDPKVMVPQIAKRPNSEPSIMAEMAVAAAKDALAEAGKDVSDVGLIIVAASNAQRAYPAISIEVQNLLGAGGYAYDMNVACSSATFGIQAALGAIQTGSAKTVLVLSPEICTGHLNFRDRDSHFIFGDGCSALCIEGETSNIQGFKVLGTKLVTKFSNNIRNNLGFLNRCETDSKDTSDRLFVQEGRRVFKDVVPMVSALISAHMDECGLGVPDIKRLWLHQANLPMNKLISKRVLGREATKEEAPTILDTYANTSSAGSVIAFHHHKSDLTKGDRGILCSFGAGYSVGSIALERV